MEDKAAKHTPGPWTLKENGEFGHAIMVNGGTIANAFPRDLSGHLHDSEANARLIAAAPDLLEACKRLLGCMSAAGWEGADDAEYARAAIAKATGK